jgi:hypothetical protein
MADRYEDLAVMKLNEYGDFFAGVFGPVAFGWLVLGYIQQGRELKISSNALRIQAEELKSSVEYQKIASERQEKALEPILDIVYIPTVRDNTNSFEISNQGVSCTKTFISWDYSGKPENLGGSDLGNLPSGMTKKFYSPTVIPLGETATITVSYLKQSGSKGSVKFAFIKLPEGMGQGGIVVLAETIFPAQSYTTQS